MNQKTQNNNESKLGLSGDCVIKNDFIPLSSRDVIYRRQSAYPGGGSSFLINDSE